MGQEDYTELSSFLERFVRRLKFLKGLEGLCLVGISLLLLFSLGLGMQEIKLLFPYAPLAYSLLAAALLGLFLGWTLYQCIRRVSRESAAIYIEKKQPILRNNLINSLQLYPEIAEGKGGRGISTAMVLALLRTTRRQLQNLRVEELTDTRRVKAESRLFGLLFVPVVGAVFLNPSSVDKNLNMLLHPLRDLPPSQTTIDVSPKGARVVRGSSVTIQAAASGAIPKSMDLLLWSDDSGQEPAAAHEKLGMEESGGGKFSFTVQEVKKSLHFRATTGPFSSATYAIEAVDPPEIGNLKMTLYPPHYTGLPAQSVQGGNIDGIKGSTVRLEAWSTKEVAKARLVLDGNKEIPLKVEGKKLLGSLVLFQTQKYQISVEDPLGFHNSPISYEMRVRPDGFPVVEILKPTEDLEINGDETLPLEFSARDDFGIQEIALSIRIGERQEKIPIEKEGNKKLIARDRFDWDLGKLGLREGDEAIYQFEVLDNDTISGPKLGSSKSLRLRLKNLKGEHRQVAEMIRDLSRQMVDLLGDHLESAPVAEKDSASRADPSDRSFAQKADEVTRRIEEIMQRSEKDRLSDFATWSDLEALKRNLQFTKEDLVQKRDKASSAEEKGRLNDEISSELERMALLSEEITKRLNAQETASTARDLMKSQERLMDSLDKLRSGDKNLDAILKEISQLANLLNSLQQSLSQFASRLPDEFLNSEALQGLSFNEMFSALEEIRKKLMQGDIEGAMQLARELFNQMASMMAALQGANQQAMSSMMGRMQGEMMRSASELEQIAREQQEVLVDTEGINKKTLGERDDLLKEKLERFQAKANEELARLAQLFPDEERETGSLREGYIDDATVNNLVKNMISRLLKKDFSGFSELTGMAQKELGKKRTQEQEQKAKQAERSLKDLQQNLAALLSEPMPAIKDEERKALRELAHRQGVLKERTEELHEKMDSLFQLFPSLDPQITKNIQEAGSSMGKAHGRLSDLDGKAAVPPEREALDRLSQSQQQMQNAMQQLAQRGQLGRMPVARLFRYGRFLPSGQLVPLPGMPQFPQFDVEGGITGLDTEKFQLPGKEEYKAPRSFREEIIEALKQGVPPQLKEQIESYFKNLSE
ncbi:MAG TPA: DUF4175 family protein [Candidatus Binatia bacterium]|nr:DUF4175 family protein [Candidatus Binatia bacterium]